MPLAPPVTRAFFPSSRKDVGIDLIVKQKRANLAICPSKEGEKT